MNAAYLTMHHKNDKKIKILELMEHVIKVTRFDILKRRNLKVYIDLHSLLNLQKETNLSIKMKHFRAGTGHRTISNPPINRTIKYHAFKLHNQSKLVIPKLKCRQQV